MTFGGILPTFNAASYSRIMGANEKVRLCCMGVNSRGLALATNFAQQENADIIYVSDVDSRATVTCISAVEKNQGRAPQAQPDFRKALEDKSLDALVIAAPDHWHAPAAILACQAGKHVYVEKPCSHNPNEGETLVKVAKKHKRIVQMGNQRRSWPNVVAAMACLQEGIIGRPYFAKTWYTNNRGSIGSGKPVAVPSWLNYDLWQGPAPRRIFKDNLIHYNWHWFWHWGTGEALNNGVHMVDLARWGLGVDFPTAVNSTGGRFQFKDDWETPDTQIINLQFGKKAMISWEGRSCNGQPIEGSAVGVIFYGEKGSLIINDGNSFKVYDREKKIIKEAKPETAINARNVADPSQNLDAVHLNNFLDAIRKGTKLNSPIDEGHISTLLVQLGNIALRTGNSLKINPENGHIQADATALKLWKREYQPGWEIKSI